MDETGRTLCPDDRMSAVLEHVRRDDEAGLANMATLLQQWPLDPRLHFLKGSVLAGQQRYAEGRQAMARAIEIAPDFAVARFQLGFLDLTSGRPVDAVGVWQKLGDLPDDAPLRLFAEGLSHLAADNFAEARRLLTKGMALNSENPMINADMQLILDEIGALATKSETTVPAPTPASGSFESGGNTATEAVPASAVDMLLRQHEWRSGPSKLKH